GSATSAIPRRSTTGNESRRGPSPPARVKLVPVAPTDSRPPKERIALGWLALPAILAIGWLAHPFATGILLGTLLGFTLEPLYHRLGSRTRRPLPPLLSNVVGR